MSPIRRAGHTSKAATFVGTVDLPVQKKGEGFKNHFAWSLIGAG
jgi:hypothetical protein